MLHIHTQLFTASLKLATSEQQLPRHPPIKRCKDSKNYRADKNLPRKTKDIGHFDNKIRQIDRYGCEFRRDSGVLYTLYNIKEEYNNKKKTFDEHRDDVP